MTTIPRRAALFLAALTGAVTAAAFAGPAAFADPVPPPECVRPDGTACEAPPPGCVDANTNLPCSSQLQDINAAIQRELQQVLGGIAGGR